MSIIAGERDDACPAAEARRILLRGLETLGKVQQTPLTALGLPGGAEVAVARFTGANAYPAYGFSHGHDPDEAATGALGELAESVVSSIQLRDAQTTTSSYVEMVRRHGPADVLDPARLGMEAGVPYSPDVVLEWTTVTRVDGYQGSSVTGRDVHVPLEYVASSFGDLLGRPRLVRLVAPVTNGLGAGFTPRAAVEHAVLEIVQRDVGTLAAKAATTGISIAGLDDHLTSRAAALRSAASNAGVELTVKYEGALLGCHVVCVTGRQTRSSDPLTALAFGECARPDLDEAVEGALLEYFQSRARLRFCHGSRAELKQDPAAEQLLPRRRRRADHGPDQRAESAFDQWLAMDEAELAVQEDRLNEVSAWIDVDQRPQDSSSLIDPGRFRPLAEPGDESPLLARVWRQGEVFVAKVIVVGAEVETLSYLRIGRRNLRRLQDHPVLGDCVRTGSRPDQRWLPASAGTAQPYWVSPSAVAAFVGALYPLYREPVIHARL